MDTEVLDASFSKLTLPDGECGKEQEAPQPLCLWAPHSLRGLVQPAAGSALKDPVLVSIMPLHLDFLALACLSQDPTLLAALHSTDPVEAAAQQCASQVSTCLACRSC